MRTVDAHERRKDFLTEEEVDLLAKHARSSRHGLRDRAMVLLAFRHGLRASELAHLQKNDLNLTTGRLWVQRVKGGLSTDQPIQGDVIRALKAYLSTRTDSLPCLFLNDRGAPITRKAFYMAVREAGKRGGIRAYPHILRHSCGYALANSGMDTRVLQDYLGHRDPRNTARYTRTASIRFEGIWGRK